MQELGMSMAEARRLLDQGAVEVDGQKVSKRAIKLRVGSVIRVGKHRFLRIVDADKPPPSL
jgi:ribosomal protein S4